MKKLLLVLALFGCLLSTEAATKKLELDSLVAGVYNPAGIQDMKPMLDPAYYTSVDDAGKRIARYSFQTGKQVDIVLDLSNVKGTAPAQIRGYAFSPNESKMLVWADKTPIYRRSYTTEYYVFDCKRNTIEPLSSAGAQRNARFSPDSRSVAFARDNNLFIKRLDFGTEVQVTTDGAKNSVINGVTDWVYEEEFTVTEAYDWSPDSKSLAFVRFNEKEVPSYTFSLFGAATSKYKKEKYYPGSYSFKYPSSGEQNSVATVWVFNLQTRSSKQMQLPVESEDYIPRIRFTRNSNQLAVMTLNRAQNLFRIFYASPKSAQSTLILTDKSETFVDPVFDAIQFTSKYFTYISEKDGYRHLYLYNANGGLNKQLTSGKWDVTRFIGCDTIRNIFYYQGDEGDPTQRMVAGVDLKGKKIPVAVKKGTNDVAFNADFTYSVRSWTDLNTPAVYAVYNAKGEEIRVLENNKKIQTALADFALPSKQFFKVPAADGQILNGWMIRPADFNSATRYPVVQLQYSGPDSQSALDQFGMGWEYLLAQEGYVVVTVDGRGTGGRGEAFRKCTYTRLGQLETEDQVAIARWLKAQPYINPERVGIWGWSFGGYMTLMCMTDASHEFKTGIAVAPVCDWHYYNTVYTERYMKTPKENPDGYEKTSPLLRAPELKGNLLLVHGLADDNVRASQSMDISEAFIRSGVQFDTQVYPTSNHSILGVQYRKHLYHRMLNYFLKNL